MDGFGIILIVWWIMLGCLLLSESEDEETDAENEKAEKEKESVEGK